MTRGTDYYQAEGQPADLGERESRQTEELNKRTSEIEFKDSQIKVAFTIFFHSFLRSCLHDRFDNSFEFAPKISLTNEYIIALLLYLLCCVLHRFQLTDTLTQMEEENL
jgi:hypothetical protein